MSPLTLVKTAIRQARRTTGGSQADEPHAVQEWRVGVDRCCCSLWSKVRLDPDERASSGCEVQFVMTKVAGSYPSEIVHS